MLHGAPPALHLARRMSQESMATKAEELHSRHLDCIGALKDEYLPARLLARGQHALTTGVRTLHCAR